MNTISKKLIAVSILCSPVAHGYTECQLTLTKVFTDNGGNFFIATGGYFNGYIAPGTPNYSPSVAAAIAARASDRPAIVRYTNDNVVCGGAAWNEKIDGIGF